MGLIPEQSFTVRVPAWHNTGTVLQDYPGREEAMRLAGHDFKVCEREVAIARRDATGTLQWQVSKDYVEHFHSETGVTLQIAPKSFERIQNEVAYDVAELILDQGFLHETGGTMDEGRQNYLTLLLPEPFTITGDNSATLPYVGMSWSHDGSGSLKVRGTSVRQVCQNTVAASEAEGKRLGTDFTFRHTKNVKERIEEAKKAIRGIRDGYKVYQEAMEELATIQVTPEQRDLFVSTIIGDRKVDGTQEKTVLSTKAANNVERERTKVLGLFMGNTIPENHVLTGYGLHLAGVEYFDHLRKYRSKDSYVKRTLLANSPEKTNLTRTIRELVAA